MPDTHYTSRSTSPKPLSLKDIGIILRNAGCDHERERFLRIATDMRYAKRYDQIFKTDICGERDTPLQRLIENNVGASRMIIADYLKFCAVAAQSHEFNFASAMLGIR